MKDPQGTIVEIVRDSRGVTAIVDIEADAVCARCASGRGCGAGILAARSGTRRLDIAVGEDLKLSEGDVVDIQLAPRNVLAAALLVYGLPLAGADGYRYRLQASRRMRSGELHYIDHPLMGVLLRIDRYRGSAQAAAAPAERP